MQSIRTEVEKVTVEIDGVEFAVAEKTVAVAEELLSLQRRMKGKPEYALWLEELKILLGKGAVKKLFYRGKKENIDRLQRIHAGVCSAFEKNAERVEQEWDGTMSGALGEVAEALIGELLRQMAGAENPAVRAIRRNDG